jgi:VWFA-related protein
MRAACVLLIPSVLLLFCPGAARAQETSIHVQSNVVLVPTLVKDNQGHPIYGLEAKDFIVQDDGVPQNVQLDEAAESEPISLIIVLQRGRQALREFPRMKGLNSMIQPILDQEQTLAAVVEFDSGIELTQDFTGDATLVNKAIKGLRPGDNGAAILDALQYSANLLNQQPQGRLRVLLLISETRDHGSRIAKLDNVVSAVGEGNTVVYALAFSPAISNVLDTERGTNQDDMNAGPDLLAPLFLLRQAFRKNTPKAVASMTGGEYELFDTQKSFETHLNDFTNHLHSRYLLSFQPKDPHSGLHELKVQLREATKGTVLARGSYWAQESVQ